MVDEKDPNLVSHVVAYEEYQKAMSIEGWKARTEEIDRIGKSLGGQISDTWLSMMRQKQRYGWMSLMKALNGRGEWNDRANRQQIHQKEVLANEQRKLPEESPSGGGRMVK